jgi:hypothetical protein
MKAVAVVLFCVIVWGMFLAIPVFAAVLGTGLAGLVLYALVTAE